MDGVIMRRWDEVVNIMAVSGGDAFRKILFITCKHVPRITITFFAHFCCSNAFRFNANPILKCSKPILNVTLKTPCQNETRDFSSVSNTTLYVQSIIKNHRPSVHQRLNI